MKKSTIVKLYNELDNKEIIIKKLPRMINIKGSAEDIFYDLCIKNNDILDSDVLDYFISISIFSSSLDDNFEKEKLLNSIYNIFDNDYLVSNIDFNVILENIQYIIGTAFSKVFDLYDEEEEKYYISVVDIVRILTNSRNPRHYWNVLKGRLKSEGNETVTNCDQLKLKAQDRKYRMTDVVDIEGMFRIIESIPSKNAEPIKMWLAGLGKERINEIFDPALTVQRAIDTYRTKGYDEKWIAKRIKGIQDRKELTDIWKANGITEGKEYAILTNEIYKEWSGMTASEYKEYKGYVAKRLISDSQVQVTSRSSASRITNEQEKSQASEQKDVSQASSTAVSQTAGDKIASYAKKYVGYNYASGGTTPSNGFDCSGFVYYVYNACGYSLSRLCSIQAKTGTEVSKSNLIPGDLVFFNNGSNGSIGHVAIYVGNGIIVHAANTRRGVTTDTINSGYYNTYYYTARRAF